MKKFFTSIVIIIFILSPKGYCQGGATCSDALTVVAGEYTTLQGSTQYFKYRANQNGVATIAACSASVDYSLLITQNCSTVVDTFMSHCESGNGMISFIIFGGQTYEFALKAAGAQSGTFDFYFSVRDLIHGETCLTAIEAVQGQNSYLSSATTAVWYKYKASRDARIEMNTCGFDYPNFVTAYASCNVNDKLETFHNSCSGTNVGRDNAFFYVKKDQIYYIQWKNPTPGKIIQFPFVLSEFSLKTAETCSDPKTLVAGKDSTGHDFVRWYKYHTAGAAAEKVAISSCGEHTFYAQVRLSCAGEDFERNLRHRVCGKSTTTTFQALPGINYYVKIYPTMNDTFSVNVEAPLLGEICAKPLTAVLNTNHADHTLNSDQWYVYTSLEPGTIKLTKDKWDSTQIRLYHHCNEEAIGINVTSAAITANEPIYILLRNSYPVVYDWNLEFTAKSAGSDRSSALIATVGTNTLNPASADIWYKYTPVVNSDVRISTCATGTTSSYVLLQDQYGKYLGASTGACGALSDITLRLIAGKTVFIHLTSSTSQIIAFNLQVLATDVIVPPGYTCDHPLVAVNGVNTDAFIGNQLWQWYTYTAETSGTMEVDNCSNNPLIFTRAFIQSACGNFDSKTLAYGNICSVNGSGTSVKLAKDQQIYIVWQHTDANAGTLVWNLNFVPDEQLSAGSTCANPISAVDVNVANTKMGDQFYLFVPASSGTFTISSSNTDPLHVAVYATCDDYAIALAAYNHPLAEGNIGGANKLVLNMNCTTGNSYYIVWKAGLTLNDFSWNLTFTEINKLAQISDFSIPDQVGATVVNTDLKTLTITMPRNTSLTALKAVFKSSEGAVVSVKNVLQVSGQTVNDFSNAVKYFITAQDGFTRDSIIISVLAVKNIETDFLTYSVENQVSGTLDNTTKKIVVKMPEYTVLTALKANFTLSPGASTLIGDVIQQSGVTENDFTVDKIYKVLAEDGVTTADWTVSISSMVGVMTAIDSSRVKVFPVPTRGIVNIEMPRNSVGFWKVQLVNTAGQIIQMPGITAEKFIRIDLTKYPVGSYSLILTQGNARLVYGIVLVK